jgi:hypothetical protein
MAWQRCLVVSVSALGCEGSKFESPLGCKVLFVIKILWRICGEQMTIKKNASTPGTDVMIF